MSVEVGPVPGSERLVSRRNILGATAALAGAAAASAAAGDTLAEVPAREPGSSLSAHGERSQFVKLARLPEAGPGVRNVDPTDAINSKTPIGDLVGTITPTDLHYERSHSGVPDIDPAKHRLLIHGLVDRARVLTLADLRAMPSVSRTTFLECTGNGWENWKHADPTLTVQNTHGLVSTNEWTGIPLTYLADLVGRRSESLWMLAEGGDAAGVARSIPLTDEIMREAMIAFGQNGEPLRPAQGYPIRLIVPGCEGNVNIKWLRRLKFGDGPWMTRWETARYTQLMADGRARQFQLRMDTNSVITSPSGMMQIHPGYQRITGLAWSGHGRIDRVDVSVDGGRSWLRATLDAPVLPKAQARFGFDWMWDGSPATIVSRSTDERGNIQPSRQQLIDKVGTNALFHFNGQQTWAVDTSGRVRNVLA
ncbi:sulfite dehydrogenase [Polymorphobacter megasporae]|uniref:sulfite dehydrogenase n=1 Tax=Glacieibacterium megasporae TaxID=2835787 RepID=UPI001C1DDBAE|nr:sulfite dehydrogenase [Polymorphobacter megasporae]UAJ12453.1 sulfite dehydrogenase [Polymorphobacter megasporae]